MKATMLFVLALVGLLVAGCLHTDTSDSFDKNWVTSADSESKTKFVAHQAASGRGLVLGCVGSMPVVYVRVPGIDASAGNPRPVEWQIDGDDPVKEIWIDDPENPHGFLVSGDEAVALFGKLQSAEKFTIWTDATGHASFELSDFPMAVTKVREMCRV